MPPFSTMTDSSTAARSSYRRIVLHSPFGLMWIGQALSGSGDMIFDIAVLWIVWVGSHNPVYIGLVQFLALIPSVAVGPLVGPIVDRNSKRSVMITTALTQGAIVGTLVPQLALGRFPPFWEMGFVVLALGAFGRIYSLAFFAAVPEVLSGPDLVRANALSSISGEVNSAASYSLAGLLILFLGASVPVSYDALTFVVCATAIWAIKPWKYIHRDQGKSSIWDSSGLRAIVSQRLITELVIIGSVTALLGNAVSVGIVVRILGATSSPGFLGGFFAAYSVGAATGSYLLGLFATSLRPGPSIAMGIAGSGAAVIGVAFSPNAYSILGFALLLGATVAVVDIPMSSLFQSEIPQGRVASVVGTAGVFWSVTGPVGAVFGGILFATGSASLDFAVLGALFVLFGGLTRSWKEVRRSSLNRGEASSPSL